MGRALPRARARSGASRRTDGSSRNSQPNVPAPRSTSRAVRVATRLWLAGLGWDVTAVDFSPAAIQKARTLARRGPPPGRLGRRRRADLPRAGAGRSGAAVLPAIAGGRAPDRRPRRGRIPRPGRDAARRRAPQRQPHERDRRPAGPGGALHRRGRPFATWTGRASPSRAPKRSTDPSRARRVRRSTRCSEPSGTCNTQSWLPSSPTASPTARRGCAGSSCTGCSAASRAATRPRVTSRPA